ncbi:MAG: hypothetical protein L0215_03780, partial [Gemmataceae bacterium]|nr:hypothetical protein [Gemmataceae bacterium]
MKSFTIRRNSRKNTAFPNTRLDLVVLEDRLAPGDILSLLLYNAWLGDPVLAPAVAQLEDELFAADDTQQLEIGSLTLPTATVPTAKDIGTSDTSENLGGSANADTNFVAAPPTEISFDVFLAATAALQNPFTDPLASPLTPPPSASTGGGGSFTPADPVNLPRSEPNGGG